MMIISVSYRSGKYLHDFVASVRSESDARIVVAENAADAVEHPELAGFDALDVVLMGTNLGYGGAVNAAIAHASPDPSVTWYLVVNPDVQLGAGAIAAMLAAGESNAAVAVVGPLVRSADNRIYPSARQLPSLRTGIGHALLGRVLPRNPWSQAYLNSRMQSTTRERVGWVSGSCMLIRRSAFEIIGGFDERFFMYFEDVDLCARMQDAGWEVVFEPGAEIVHVGGHATLDPVVRRSMVLAHHRSAYTYLSARYPGAVFAPMRAALKAALAIRGRLVGRP